MIVPGNIGNVNGVAIMKDLTQGNIYKTFFLFSIPLILSGVLSQMFSTVNAIMAGWFFENGLAAIGATEPFCTFISSIFWGFNTGVGVAVAKLFGAKQYLDIKRSVSTFFVLIGTTVTVVSVLIAALHPLIFDFLQIDPALRSDAAGYFVVYMIAVPFIILNNAYLGIFHAFGISGFSSFTSILSMSLCCIGNVVIVGCFNIGPMGLAISSLFGNVVVLILNIRKLKSCYRELGVADEKVRFDRTMLPELFRYGVPTSFQQMAMYFASMILSPFTNRLGADASAAYSVQTRIVALGTALYFNGSKALGNYTSQSIGARQLDNLKKGVKAGFLQGMVLALPSIIVCVLFPKAVASLFLGGEETGMALTYATQFAQFCIPFTLFNMVGNLFHSYFRGAGVMRALIVTTLSGSIVRIILTALLVGPYGMYGVFVGWVGSWIVDGGLGLLIYFTTNWPALLADKVPSSAPSSYKKSSIS